jgi:transposase InsO family protein
MQPIRPLKAHTTSRFRPHATCAWVSWFNEERIHGELGDRSPAQVEAAYYRHQSQPDAA